MQKVIHGPGIVPTFETGANSPLSDLSVGDTWRGIPGNVGFPFRFSFIDEPAPGDDADYISQGLGNGGSIYICDCGPVPVATAGAIVVSYRVRRMGGSGVWSATLRLSRGGTPIHDETISPINPNLPLDFTTISGALSAGEIATLFGAAGNIQILMSCAGGPQVPFTSDAIECSWVRLAYFA